MRVDYHLRFVKFDVESKLLFLGTLKVGFNNQVFMDAIAVVSIYVSGEIQE
jgi:hypothetical protein